MPRIFETPYRFFSPRRRLGLDSILETRALERDLPVFNALYQVRHPFLWSSRIDIIHDRLFRLNKLPPLVALYILGLWFKPPALDETHNFHTLGICIVISIALSEITNSFISKSFAHWHLWQ